jgi:hypothetical protein
MTRHVDGGNQPKLKLLFLDLRNPAAPRASDRDISLPKDSYSTGLTVDSVDRAGFYLGYRTLVGEDKSKNGITFYRWKDFAARWDLSGDEWERGETVNVPGRLVRTWRGAGNDRMLLTSDYVSKEVTDPANPNQNTWASWTRISLLRVISLLGGKPAAELMDSRTFEDLNMSSLVADGQRIFVNGQAGYGPWWGYGYRGGVSDGVAVSPGGGSAPVAEPGRAAVTTLAQTTTNDRSDRLMALDLSKNKLNLVYDQSTKMHNVQLMGVHENRLFMNLAGDGIMIVDVADAQNPFGVQFHRTLGWATHIEFAGDDAYVGSGFFGTTHLDLRGLPTIPSD